MKLENFDLAEPFQTVVVNGLGHTWDLHNFAEFKALTFHPERNEVVMEWTVPNGEANPWSSLGNIARGCRLRFSGVTHLAVHSRDPGLPLSEASCLESVAKVIPGELSYPFKTEWSSGEPFHLRFTFMDERVVEVESERVVLEPME